MVQPYGQALVQAFKQRVWTLGRCTCSCCPRCGLMLAQRSWQRWALTLLGLRVVCAAMGAAA
eukprot:365711-Chlamydomonas_euryale.AAC.21